MNYALRLTDSRDKKSYPLPLNGYAKWQSIDAWGSDTSPAWRATIELPTTPSGHILVPSFSMLGVSYEYQVALVHNTTGHTNRLNPLLTSTENLAKWPEKCSDLSAVSAQIDCWHSEAELTNVAFVITVQCERQPEKYLFALSIRPVTLTCEFVPSESIALALPRAISQMTAEPNLRNRICSPISLAIVNASLTGNMAFTEIVEGCYDPATKAYGKWPLAVYQANKLNLVGAVEALPSWQCVIEVLAKQWLIVCSIRFAKDSLEGAPLQQSAGHLIVLYGIDVTDPEQPHVLVMDPAGKTQEDVQRRYKLAEFSKAWLDHRGGAYILNQAIHEE
jgi:hypothetical protein